MVNYQGYDIKLRVFCSGVSSENKPSILFEVGGGSSGVDIIGLQKKLEKDYKVCSYDRAGYGKSW